MVMHAGIRKEGKMSNKYILTVVTAVIVVMITAPAFPAEDLFDTAAAAKHMDQGFTFLKAKKYDAAVKEFEEAASVNPDAEAYYYLGYAYYIKGRNGDEESRKKSRENFAKTYEIDSNFSPTRVKASTAAQSENTMQKGEPREAGLQPAPQEPLQTRSTATAP
jgi:tetratricopeptide (TPR) repeat protein